MNAANNKKIELLRKSFEALKDDYDNNAEMLGQIILKASLVDIKDATFMWEYLLNKYRSTIQNQDETYITGDIIEELFYLDFDKIESVILSSAEVKNVLFHEAKNIDSQSAYISYLIEEDKLQLAEELLGLLYSNPNKKSNWYHVMSCAMPSEEEISLEGYQLLENWCDKVTNISDRKNLTAKMVKYI